MTVMGLSVGEVAALTGIASFVGGILLFVARYVLRAEFTHRVGPEMGRLSTALNANTHVTAVHTEQLATSEDERQRTHRETRETFQEIRNVLTNHEARISVVEMQVEPQKPAPRIKPRRNT